MDTLETDITNHPITDEDLAGIDEQLHGTVRDLYAASGHREFAITVARNAERRRTHPELQLALLLNAVDSAIDSGQRPDTQVASGRSLVEMLAQLFPAEPGTQEAAHVWHELDTQLAKLAGLPQLPRDFYSQVRAAVRIGQYAYAATESSDFAVAMAGAFETKVTKGRKPSLWPVIQSAIAAGADLDTRIRCSDLRGLLRFLDPDKDIDVDWSKSADEIAITARHAEIARALAAEYDDDDKDFSPFFSRRLNWFDNKDDPQLLGKVCNFLDGADEECLAMDDVATALKRHVGIPDPIVDEAFDKLANRKKEEERRKVLQRIRGHYDTDGQYRILGTSVIPMSLAAAGNTSVPPAIWGEGMDVLWTEDESLIIEASYGVGKTTLAGLLLRGKFCGGEVLGYPVRKLPDGQRILYLALDRPEQIVRSMLRQFTQQQLDELGNRLSIWRGPLPGDAAENDHLLTDLADMHEADVIFVDSVKDAALGLSEDRAAAIYQRGRQRLLQSGRQLVELHHLTKGGDTYGSIWLNAGVGSVVRLKGAAGGPTATLTHLKSPARRVDPIEIIHDRANGGMTVAAKQAAERGGCDAGESTADEPTAAGLPEWVAGHGPEGVTGSQAADWLYRSNGRNDKVRAQRALNALCGEGGPLRHVGGSRGGDIKTPARWVARCHD